MGVNGMGGRPGGVFMMWGGGGGGAMRCGGEGRPDGAGVVTDDGA